MDLNWSRLNGQNEIMECLWQPENDCWHNPRVNFCQEYMVLPCQFHHMGKYSTQFLCIIAVQIRRNGRKDKKMYTASSLNNVIPRAPLIRRIYRDHLGLIFGDMVWKKLALEASHLNLLHTPECSMQKTEKMDLYSKNPAFMIVEVFMNSLFHTWKEEDCLTGLLRDMFSRKYCCQIFTSLRNVVRRCM